MYVPREKFQEKREGLNLSKKTFFSLIICLRMLGWLWMFSAPTVSIPGPAAVVFRRFAALSASLSLLGCANPGPPRPPSLHLAKPATGLAAQRVGGKVLLSFTVPDETTDGGAMRPPIAAMVCREVSAAPDLPCHEVLRVQVNPGRASVTDPLSPALASGEPRLMVYRVELLNANGHGAGESAPVFAAAGAVPPPMGMITVAPRRNAAQITWQPQAQPPGTEIRVDRTLLATTAGPEQPARGKNAAPEPQRPGTTLKQAVLSSGAGLARDPGGLIDRGIHDGDTLKYVAERVRTVSLAVPEARETGHPGDMQAAATRQQSFELRGEPSPPAKFIFQNDAPPLAPTGLAAVPGGGFGQPASIDLSWEAGSEEDVLGYYVYRAGTAPGEAFARLNATPVPSASFRDLTAQPGGVYRYRVTAVDVRHHESPPSGEVLEHLTQ
jgi:hypothetical protein